MSGKPRDIELERQASKQRNLVSLSLALFLILAAFGLEYSNSFRMNRYPIGTGVGYPSWQEFRPSWKEELLERSIDQCKGNSATSVSCALLSKARSGERSTNEVAVIGRATAEDRTTSYCDRFYGACASQPANVTLDDASQIFDYLELAYLDPARENIERGRMARAYLAINRIGYALGPIDLPLGSENCCSYADAQFIASAFLGDKRRWNNRDYVEAVLAIPDAGRPIYSDEDRFRHEKTGRYPDTAAYARGITANGDKCFRIASVEFYQLAKSDDRRAVRELAAYMALLARFRGQLYSNESCTRSRSPPPPPDLTAAEVAQLKAAVSRRSFLTDIQQMEAASARRGPSHAP